MTYNTDNRRPLRGRAREAFLEAHGRICYWCREPIIDGQWDDEHVIARELVAPGTWADDMSNRRPIHRGPCHKAKSALDRKIIAKSNRIRRKHAAPAQERAPTDKRAKIRSGGFDKTKTRRFDGTTIDRRRRDE